MNFRSDRQVIDPDLSVYHYHYGMPLMHNTN